MSIPPIINTRFFGPISTILENIAGTEVVEHAWASVGLSRGSLEKEHVFVPYQLQAEFGESAARQTGERHIGALVNSSLPYISVLVACVSDAGSQESRANIMYRRHDFQQKHISLRQIPGDVGPFDLNQGAAIERNAIYS